MNHTPGPYNIGKPGGPSGPFWSLVNQHGIVVAMQITTEANARLLASAPDLLAACLDLVENGNSCRYDHNRFCQEHACGEPCSYDMARAAIVKTDALPPPP